MKKTYNIDEDINHIKTGDTVLISGLYGKNFKFINNKTATIKNIFVRVEDGQVIPLAYVTINESKRDYVVNFDYIFKIDIEEGIVDSVSQHIFTIENPFLFYVYKKGFKKNFNFQDELGQCMTIGIDKNGKTHVILFSGIN